MRSLKSGARKKPWRVGSSQPRKENTHSCSRFPFLSFSLRCGSFFEYRSARNGCCWVWRQRTRASWCHQDVAWCWCWELSERSGLCKATIHFGSQWVAGSKGGIDAAGSWTKTVLIMCRRQTGLVPRYWCFSTPPMKQRKNWNEKMAKAIAIKYRPIMTARASSSNFERSPTATQNFSKR